jgi:hypothetical protein
MRALAMLLGVVAFAVGFARRTTKDLERCADCWGSSPRSRPSSASSRRRHSGASLCSRASIATAGLGACRLGRSRGVEGQQGDRVRPGRRGLSPPRGRHARQAPCCAHPAAHGRELVDGKHAPVSEWSLGLRAQRAASHVPRRLRTPHRRIKRTAPRSAPDFEPTLRPVRCVLRST